MNLAVAAILAKHPHPHPTPSTVPPVVVEGLAIPLPVLFSVGGAVLLGGFVIIKWAMKLAHAHAVVANTSAQAAIAAQSAGREIALRGTAPPARRRKGSRKLLAAIAAGAAGLWLYVQVWPALAAKVGAATASPKPKPKPPVTHAPAPVHPPAPTGGGTGHPAVSHSWFPLTGTQILWIAIVIVVCGAAVAINVNRRQGR